MRNSIVVALTCAFLLIASTVSAQSYTVYSVVGSVALQTEDQVLPLHPRKILSRSELVKIGEESAVTVIDEKKGILFSFTTEGLNTVSKLVSLSAPRAKKLTRSQVSSMVKQLYADESQQMSHPEKYMFSSMSTRSATADSLMLNQLDDLLAGDKQHAVETRLVNPEVKLATNYDVKFDLIDCETGVPVDEPIAKGAGCYVRVSNPTSEVLYVNVLNIDGSGNKYLILPVDAASSCAHLLVPAESTVAFKSEPFVFGDEPSSETFLLIATPNPVDFSILMNPMQAFGGRGMNTGLYRRFFKVQ